MSPRPNKHDWTWCLLALLALWAGTALAQEGPALSLYTFKPDRPATQYAADPLLLYVGIDNTAARIVEQRNQRNQEIVEQFTQTSAYQELSRVEKIEFAEQYPIEEIPHFNLGSGQVAVQELIGFLVKDERGQAVDMAIRPLAGNPDLAGSVDLSAERSLLFLFAAESAALRRLPAGRYQIVASLDTTRQANMWNGWVFSDGLTVQLLHGLPDPQWDQSDNRMLMQSSFLVKDLQFDLAEDHARQWLSRKPDSIDAWAQLGEALDGLGRQRAALEAFETAVAKFRLRYGNLPDELPMALLDRIQVIEESLNTADP